MILATPEIDPGSFTLASMMSSATLSIAAASLADVAVLSEIGRETYSDHFSAIWTPGNLSRFLERDFSESALRTTLAAPDRHSWWIATESPDRVAGFAKVNWNAIEPVTGMRGAELQKIYFRRGITGKGHGARLVNVIIEEAVARGSGLIWLDVLKTNAGAQRLYARLGFRICGEQPFAADTGEIGMFIMRRDI
ncbi:ribosomal protein S18 acetylase RimI-like enzyme [Povalibacter uvarum]|uniref:Ribosomal protein S18 acetylase RimI-like enzyme n=1 Tax=Povalibacter uvarum TaxID=732238 RepID=A0A841HS18_9GAMM|nr:GNAT family N-acetyltransferase [Povalibacter uvarum]MBB6095563.1 ribosomal protein S18 acetylase RimI-like enzyme [Povalibacter uvarum]